VLGLRAAFSPSASSVSHAARSWVPYASAGTRTHEGVTMNHKVRYVLYWGLGVLIVVYAIVYFVFLR
jgi:hypothetical protein